MFKFLLTAALSAVGFCQYSALGNWTNSSATFTNPILQTGGADPWVFRHDGHYYMTYTNNENIMLYRSDVLTDWNNAKSKLLFKPQSGFNYSTDLWAPEVHNLNGNWYIESLYPHGQC
jgi:GH43 family beta-xylosidase